MACHRDSGKPRFVTLRKPDDLVLISLMAIRLRAFLMLLVVGLVLPAAGSPHFFCNKAGTFIQKSDCCDCSDDDRPDPPCCVTAPEPIPDALSANALTRIAPDYLSITPFELPPPPSDPHAVESPPEWSEDGGPQAVFRLYLLRHSLLL